MDWVVVLWEVASRFLLGKATSSLGVCFPRMRRRPGPAHDALGEEEKSGIKLYTFIFWFVGIRVQSCCK